MRHGNKINALGRSRAHRKALLMNLANSLITHKRINTTLAKAKELRRYIEPLLTRSKNDSTHSRRTVFSYLKNNAVVSELFRDIAPKIASRPGGYTRILKTGNRLGDAAEMCFIELVDFNQTYVPGEKKVKAAKPKTRRGRKKVTAGPAAPTEVNEPKAENKAEEPKAAKKTKKGSKEKKSE